MLNKKLTLQDETNYKFGGEAVFGVSKHILFLFDSIRNRNIWSLK